PPGGRRVRRPPGAGERVARPADHGDRRWTVHRGPAARGRRPADDGVPEGDQRRVVEHPHCVVPRTVRSRRGGCPGPGRQRAAAAGISAAIHAIGDRACTVALDSFAATGARGRIEHAQLLTDADVARMADLGVQASVQPGHLVADRDVVDLIWADRAARAYRFADLHRAGVALALGSDAPVAPLDPWLAISAAVHRTDDDRPGWHAEQRLDLTTALHASWGPVAQVRPGGPADLVLLDRHPDSLLGQHPRPPQALATVCAGRLTHLGW